MKYLFYTLIISTVSLPVAGQITLTQSDVGPINNQLTVEWNDNYPNVSPGASGPNAIWNFGPIGSTYVDTFTYANPQFTPFASDYPTANIATIHPFPLYVYGELDNSAFRIIGQADDYSAGAYTYRYLKPETVLQFPFTYQSSFKDTSVTILQMYMGFDPGIGSFVDSFRSITTTYKNIVADAYGNLTTVYGTMNTIRMNNLQYVETVNDYYINGAWVSAMPATLDSSRVYTWWANGVGTPLLELTEDLSSNTISQSVVLTTTQMILSTEQIEDQSKVNIYPNPANDVLHINGTSSLCELKLLNAQGQTVLTENVNTMNHTVDLTGLSEGVYFLRLTDLTNGTTRCEKIIKGR